MTSRFLVQRQDVLLGALSPLPRIDELIIAIRMIAWTTAKTEVATARAGINSTKFTSAPISA